MDAYKIIVMTSEMTGEMIVEVAGEMTAAVIDTAVMIAATTEEMIGVNLMTIAETLLRDSRLRLPLQAKEQETTIEMITRLKMLRTWSSPPLRTTSAAFADSTKKSTLWRRL